MGLGPDLGAFRSRRAIGAWAGVAPGNNKSAGKHRSRRVRQGNPALCATLAECAHGAGRTKGTQFHRHHRALKGRLGYKRALLDTAHKMLRTTIAMRRDDKPYHHPGLDYERQLAERNAPRPARLVQHTTAIPATLRQRGPQIGAAPTVRTYSDERYRCSY